MLIRILEKLCASIVKKLSVEVFFVSNSIWFALVRMLSHVSKYQKMLKQIILGVLVKNLEATEKKRKAH
jgi:hypothetical protein